MEAVSCKGPLLRPIGQISSWRSISAGLNWQARHSLSCRSLLSSSSFRSSRLLNRRLLTNGSFKPCCRPLRCCISSGAQHLDACKGSCSFLLPSSFLGSNPALITNRSASFGRATPRFSGRTSPEDYVCSIKHYGQPRVVRRKSGQEVSLARRIRPLKSSKKSPQGEEDEEEASGKSFEQSDGWDRRTAGAGGPAAHKTGAASPGAPDSNKGAPAAGRDRSEGAPDGRHPISSEKTSNGTRAWQGEAGGRTAEASGGETAPASESSGAQAGDIRNRTDRASEGFGERQVAGWDSQGRGSWQPEGPGEAYKDSSWDLLTESWSDLSEAQSSSRQNASPPQARPYPSLLRSPASRRAAINRTLRRPLKKPLGVQGEAPGGQGSATPLGGGRAGDVFEDMDAAWDDIEMETAAVPPRQVSSSGPSVTGNSQEDKGADPDRAWEQPLPAGLGGTSGSRARQLSARPVAVSDRYALARWQRQPVRGQPGSGRSGNLEEEAEEEERTREERRAASRRLTAKQWIRPSDGVDPTAVVPVREGWALQARAGQNAATRQGREGFDRRARPRAYREGKHRQHEPRLAGALLALRGLSSGVDVVEMAAAMAPWEGMLSSRDLAVLLNAQRDCQVAWALFEWIRGRPRRAPQPPPPVQLAGAGADSAEAGADSAAARRGGPTSGLMPYSSATAAQSEVSADGGKRQDGEGERERASKGVQEGEGGGAAAAGEESDATSSPAADSSQPRPVTGPNSPPTLFESPETPAKTPPKASADTPARIDSWPNIYLCNIMVKLLARGGQLERARGLFQQMLEAGPAPTNITFSTLIEAYGRAGRCSEAVDLMDLMAAGGLEPDEVGLNTMMSVHRQRGDVAAAERLYRRFLVRQETPKTPAVFTTMMAFYADIDEGGGRGGGEGGAGGVERADRVFADLEASGCQLDTASFNVIIRAHQQRGDLERAEAYLARLDRCRTCAPDTETFNALIGAYARRGEVERAEALFERMGGAALALEPPSSQQPRPAAAICRNRVTYETMVHMYARAGAVEKAERTFLDMEGHTGRAPDVALHNALLAAYGRASMGARAEALFARMQARNAYDVTSCNIMMSIYGDMHLPDAAASIFRLCRPGLRSEDLRRGEEGGVTPGTTSREGGGAPAPPAPLASESIPGPSTSDLRAAGESSSDQRDRLAEEEEGEEEPASNSLTDINGPLPAPPGEQDQRRGRRGAIEGGGADERRPPTAAAAMAAAARAAAGAAAVAVAPNVVTYNSLIAAYAKAGQWEEAVGALRMLEADGGVKPDCVSYTAAIQCCARHGPPRLAMLLMDDMTARGLAPGGKLTNAVATGLVREDLLDEALAFYARHLGLPEFLPGPEPVPGPEPEPRPEPKPEHEPELEAVAGAGDESGAGLDETASKEELQASVVPQGDVGDPAGRRGEGESRVSTGRAAPGGAKEGAAGKPQQLAEGEVSRRTQFISFPGGDSDDDGLTGGAGRAAPRDESTRPAAGSKVTGGNRRVQEQPGVAGSQPQAVRKGRGEEEDPAVGREARQMPPFPPSGTFGAQQKGEEEGAAGQALRQSGEPPPPPVPLSDSVLELEPEPLPGSQRGVPDRTSGAGEAQETRARPLAQPQSQAQQSLELASTRDDDVEATWGGLIEVLGRQGKIDEAWAALQRMQETPAPSPGGGAAGGVQPNVVMYTSLMMAYGRQGLVDEAEAVFASMRDAGVAPDTRCCTTLMAIYGEARPPRVAECERLFREMEGRLGCRRSAASYCCMMEAYMRARRFKLARAVAREARDAAECEMSREAYNCLIGLYATTRQVEHAEGVHLAAARSGLLPDEATHNRMAAMYKRAGLLEEASEHVAAMAISDPDDLSFPREQQATPPPPPPPPPQQQQQQQQQLGVRGPLAGSRAPGGLVPRPPRSLSQEDRRAEGFQGLALPTRESPLAPGGSGSRGGGEGRLEGGGERREKAEEAGGNEAEGGSLARAAGAQGRPQEEKRFQAESESGNDGSGGRADASENSRGSREMRHARDATMGPAQTRGGQAQEQAQAQQGRAAGERPLARLTNGAATAARRPLSLASMTTMITVHSRAGRHEAALKLWRLVGERGMAPDVAVCNAMIVAFGRAGRFDEALRLFVELERKWGLKPTQATYMAVIVIYGKGGLLEGVTRMFRRMRAAGIEPNAKAYRTMIEIYDRAGRDDLIAMMEQEMQFANFVKSETSRGLRILRRKSTQDGR